MVPSDSHESDYDPELDSDHRSDERGAQGESEPSSPDEEELADSSRTEDDLIGVDEARERSGGDGEKSAETEADHDRAEGYS